MIFLVRLTKYLKHLGVHGFFNMALENIDNIQIQTKLIICVYCKLL